MTAEPSANVVVTVSGGAQATVSGSPLTFTTLNWNVPQTITVTAVNDDLIETAHTQTITHIVSSVDTDFNAVAVTNVTANITDNDVAGFTVTPSLDVSLTEGATNATAYAVVLTAQPSTNVVVTISESSSALTANTTSLTFTNANWNVAQNVSITGTEDANLVSEADQVVTFSIVDASSDNNFDPLADITRNVDITDNDSA